MPVSVGATPTPWRSNSMSIPPGLLRRSSARSPIRRGSRLRRDLRGRVSPMNGPPAQPRRPIRSFVLRQGRFSPAQQRARDQLLPRYGIAYVPAVLDLTAAFGRGNPKILEIGSGMGEATAAIAEVQPDRDFLAVEVHSPGVGGLLKLIEEKSLTNVRVIQHDAVEVVDRMIAPGALAGIHVFFPDPWPKKRHHKRRLLQAAFIHALALRLAPGAYLHAATDWEG